MHNEIQLLVATLKIGSMVKEYIINDGIKQNQSQEYYDAIKKILLSDNTDEIKEGELLVFLANN